MNEYYGARRKRHIDMSRFQQKGNITVHSMNGWHHEIEEEEDWKEETELEEGYEEVQEDEEIIEKEMSRNYENKANGFSIDGKAFIPKERKKKQTFVDTHVRYTTYVEKNLLQIIRMLQETGQIESITKFVNDSIKDHLLNHYHKDN